MGGGEQVFAAEQRVSDQPLLILNKCCQAPPPRSSASSRKNTTNSRSSRPGTSSITTREASSTKSKRSLKPQGNLISHAISEPVPKRGLGARLYYHESKKARLTLSSRMMSHLRRFHTRGLSLSCWTVGWRLQTVLLTDEFKPAPAEQLLAAFRILDPEGKGYIKQDVLKNLLTLKGIMFRKQEYEQFENYALDKKSKDRFYYEEYVSKLIEENNQHLDYLTSDYDTFKQNFNK